MDADRNLGIRINQRHLHATQDYQYHYLARERVEQRRKKEARRVHIL